MTGSGKSSHRSTTARKRSSKPSIAREYATLDSGVASGGLSKALPCRGLGAVSPDASKGLIISRFPVRVRAGPMEQFRQACISPHCLAQHRSQAVLGSLAGKHATRWLSLMQPGFRPSARTIRLFAYPWRARPCPRTVRGQGMQLMAKTKPTSRAASKAAVASSGIGGRRPRPAFRHPELWRHACAGTPRGIAAPQLIDEMLATQKLFKTVPDPARWFSARPIARMHLRQHRRLVHRKQT